PVRVALDERAHLARRVARQVGRGRLAQDLLDAGSQPRPHAGQFLEAPGPSRHGRRLRRGGGRGVGRYLTWQYWTWQALVVFRHALHDLRRCDLETLGQDPHDSLRPDARHAQEHVRVLVDAPHRLDLATL